MSHITKLSSLGLVVALAASPVFADDDAWRETVEIQQAFNSGGTFELSNRNGDVDVNSWDQNEIRIVAHKKVRVESAHNWFARLIGLKTSAAKTEEDVQEVFDALTPEAIGDANHLSIESPRVHNHSGIRYSIDYEIFVPNEANISLDLTNGKATVEGLEGEIGVETTNGTVRCRDIVGSVTAESTNGSIRCSDIEGDFSADTVNGRIELSLDVPPARRGVIHCKTVNGSIRVELPSESTFDVAVKTRSGSIRNDFDLSSIEEDGRRRLDGVVGAGGARVELSTVNGSVTIEAL